MKRAIIILLLLAAAIGVGFGVEQGILAVERRTHPRLYRELVEYYAARYSVPEEIIYAVIRTESSFRSSAISPRGAIGLMQITPDTFNWLNWRRTNQWDIEHDYNLL